MTLRLVLLAVISSFLATASIASAADVPVWKQYDGGDLPGAGKSMTEPEQIFVVSGTCSGCGYRLVDLTWEDWGSVTTAGTGRAVPIGGPGTCGYPPKGCQYPVAEAKVYLSEARQMCGELRYHGVRTLINGESFRYRDVGCDGLSKIPEPKPPKIHHPKPKLKRGTSVRVVKDALQDFKNRTYWRKSFDRSIACKRSTRLTMGCKARWKKSATDNGVAITLQGTLRGKVHKLPGSGLYRVRFRVNVDIIGSNTFGHSPGPFIIYGTYN